MDRASSNSSNDRASNIHRHTGSYNSESSNSLRNNDTNMPVDRPSINSSINRSSYTSISSYDRASNIYDINIIPRQIYIDIIINPSPTSETMIVLRIIGLQKIWNIT